MIAYSSEIIDLDHEGKQALELTKYQLCLKTIRKIHKSTSLQNDLTLYIFNYSRLSLNMFTKHSIL